MKTIVIGDIHGCYNELKSLLLYLETKGEYDKTKDKLVFLGDYIDRGKNSRLVIKLVRSLQENNNNVVALMGNHEDMLINYYKGIDDSWSFNGHFETLKSYEGFEKEFEDDVKWMKNLPLYHEDEHCVYVHAGVDVYKPIEKQRKMTLLWTREPFIYATKEYYKKVIFGHTSTLFLNNTDKPVYTEAFNIGIDTGCVYGGALTALIIEDGEEKKFYQTPKEKEIKTYNKKSNNNKKHKKHKKYKKSM